MKHIIYGILALALLSLLLLSGCKQIPQERRCSVDSDCGCGNSLTTGKCIIANKQYIDTTKCNMVDFCTGITGDIRQYCINGECVNR